MKKFLSILAAVTVAFAFVSCNSSKDNSKEQVYQYFISQSSEVSDIGSENVELSQLLEDLKRDVEIWGKSNVASYSVKYETESELAEYDKAAIENLNIYVKRFTTWKAQEYDSKLQNTSYYGAGSFKLTYKAHVQSIIGGKKEVTDPVDVVFEYSTSL